MQFTPQQLSGGPKFSSCTRIGNWQEEIAMEESKLANFQKRCSSGSSSLRQQQAKLSTYNEIVPHTFSDDGTIRFGDYIILQHDSSGSILACDPTEDLIPGQGKFLVTGLLDAAIPRARNTFQIVRPPIHLKNLEDDKDDPIVRVGQAFCLACNETLLLQPNSSILAPTLYLASTKKTERSATRSTNRQMIFLAPRLDAEAIWTVVKPSKGRIQASDRLLSLGTPVLASDIYQVTHRQTNMYLNCDPAESAKTEFGVELECYADRSTSSGKLGLLVSEFKGASTAQTLTKPDSPTFAWYFVLSNDPTTAVETRALPPKASNDVLLGELRSFVISRGIDGFWDLRIYFQELEKQLPAGSKLHTLDLKDAQVSWGIPFDPRYLDTLIALVDKKKAGLVDWREFLSLVRGSTSYARQDILIDVFSRMDSRGDGVVAIEDLSTYFNGEDHPLVRIGGLSDQDAFEHFVRCTTVPPKGPSGRKPSVVTFDAFSEYYADLSAAVSDDGDFESIVRSNWRP